MPTKPTLELLDMIWPETGLSTTLNVPDKPRDTLGEDDQVQLSIDFVTLTLSPLELIQLAAFLRVSMDEILDRHPSLQRQVVNAFDIKD
ncbi:MAG: hypothetical protein M9953_03600 [Thermomicrobiales bacterium]|nr:hypothetical protein [Thermomicrobiales bacterium]MCO5224403.1 hypothetical protein [Thermomicrobiales bacterium]MCO5228231.1 hypothetical protein [Thermomicrobiales bacterium]